MTPDKVSRIIKIAASVCFTFIIASLILIRNSPAEGYELSIYSAVPLPVWVFLIISIAGGLGIIVHQAFAKKQTGYWWLGFVILILSNAIIVFMAPMRGYFLVGAGDSAVHVGLAENIISYGSFGGSLYPITHTLIAQISQICDIPAVVIARYIPGFFSLLSMVFVYLLARVTLPHRGQVLLAAAAGTILFYGALHVSIYPQALAVLTLPMTFYLYFRNLQSPSVGFTLLFIVMIALYVYFYVLVSMAIIIFLIAIELVKAYRRERASPNSIIICFVVLFTWISSSLAFGNTVQHIAAWLRGEVTQVKQVEQATVFLQSMERSDVIEFFSKMYTENLIYAILSLIAVVMIVRMILHHQRGTRNPLLLAVLFLIGFPFHISLALAITAVSLGRLANLNFAMWITPVLVAFALYELFKRKSVALSAAVVGSILFFCSVVAIFSVYYSPYVLEANNQVTYQDVRGTEWFFTHKEPQLLYSSLGWQHGLAEGLLERGGSAATTFSKNYQKLYYRQAEFAIPDYLGYDEFQSFGDSVAEDRYLILTHYFKLVVSDPVLSQSMAGSARGNIPTCDEHDLAKVEHDPAISKLYSNGEFNILYVTSTR